MSIEIADNEINNIELHQGNIWFATDDNGLFKISNGIITEILNGSGEVKLLKSYNGGLLFIADKSYIVLPNSPTTRIKQRIVGISEDHFWFNLCLDCMVSTPQKFPLIFTRYINKHKSGLPYRVACLNGDTYWLSKLIGLDKFNIQTHAFEKVPIPLEYRYSRITDLDSLDKDCMVISTLSSGLLIYKWERVSTDFNK